MKGIRVGMVGAGLIAREHCGSLSRTRLARELLYYDVDERRAQQLASEYGGRVVESLGALCGQVDIVWIAAPQFAHADIVKAACKAGKPVFCEKPLAHTPDDARKIRQAVRRAGVPFFMGQSGRYNAVFRKMKELTAQGVVGEPVKVWSIRQGQPDMSRHPAWRFDDTRCGGTVVELGVHEIDFVRWVGGEFTSVCASGSSRTLAPEKLQDSVSVVGELAGGATASLEICWADPRYLWQRGVVGTEGSLFFDDSTFAAVFHHRPGRKPRVVRTRDWVYRPTGEGESIRNQARTVLRAVIEGTPPPVTLVDGLAAVEVAFAIRRSAETGRVVRV